MRSPRFDLTVIGVLLLTTATAAQGPAQAQSTQQTQTAAEARDAAKELVGGWEISNADRDKRCALTFSTDPAPGGMTLALDPDCSNQFPAFKDITAWKFGPKEEVRLIDTAGAAIIEFAEVESGMYEGHREGEGLFFMQAQAALKVQASPEQMVGDWKLLRELDKPLCTVTLSNTDAGEGSFKLVVKPGCNAAIVGFGPVAWKLDSDQLVMTGRGGVWRFTESDTTVWERVPLSTDPLLLMRQ